MANNNDIEIKVKVDTSDVDKSFKDIEKSSDKMAKNVVKDTDKINKAQDQLERQLKDTSKSMKDIFKNINVTGVTKAMNDVQRSVSKTVANVKQQLQDALNIKANVDINTKTTNKSDGANQGTNMTGSLVGSAMSGGVIGSKIAKELSQSMDKELSQIKGAFNTTVKDMKSEAETLSMVFDGIDDNLIGQMNRVKAEVVPIMEHINECMREELGENVVTDALDMTDFSRNVSVARSEVEALTDDFKSMKENLGFKEEGFQLLSADIRDTVDRVDDLTWGLTEASSELSKLLKPRGKGITLNEEKIEVAIQLLEKLNNEVTGLETTVNSSNFFDNLDLAPILSSLEQFQQAQTKANAQPLINELRKLNEEAKAVGVSVRGADEVLRQYAQIEANSSQLTNEFANNLIRVCQQVKAYNAQVQINNQAQALMKQRQAEINSQTTTLGQTLVKAKHHLQDFGTALKQAFSSGMQKAGQYIDNLKNKSQQMANAHKQAANKIKSANTGIMASFKSLLTSMMPFLTLYGAFNLIKTSVTEAMGAIESNNMYMAVFGDKASEMDKWIKSVNQSMGLGVNNTKQYTAIIQQMGSAMGLTSDEAMNMSQKMAVMAGDISSFYNVDLAQAQDDLRSALSGSNEVKVIA